MLHKGKLLIFLLSALIALYGISAAFYGKVVATDQAYPALSVLMDALHRIDADYVEPPDSNKIQQGAMRGLIDALDPYSCFLSREQVQELERRNQEAAGGIGIVVSKRGDVVYVVSVLPGSPADQAGIRPGDYIIGIDGASVDTNSPVEIESKLRGEPDSKVRLSIFRSARTEPVEIEAQRAVEPPPAVNARLLEGKVGVLSLSSLRPPAAEQAKTKLKTLLAAGAEKLVLDLRDCADGRAADGAKLANLFLRNGVLYLSKDREGKIVEQAEADPADCLTDLPMVVLINGSTAGAAEITAGALKDHERARIVGERSFGAASYQKRISLKSGALLILSTARYYTPKGKMIQEDNARSTGIRPDVQSPDSDRRQELIVEAYYDDKEDAAKYRELRSRIQKEQLEKALEILKTMPNEARRAA